MIDRILTWYHRTTSKLLGLWQSCSMYFCCHSLFYKTLSFMMFSINSLITTRNGVRKGNIFYCVCLFIGGPHVTTTWTCSNFSTWIYLPRDHSTGKQVVGIRLISVVHNSLKKIIKLLKTTQKLHYHSQFLKRPFPLHEQSWL